MGLAGPKRKQRLVGAASSRNANWIGDATLPGQRLLSQMGWQEGQHLGTEASNGRTEAVKAMFKMDNKGIGSHRAEKEAREKGLPGPGMDRWIGGGGELGGLFDRLNAGASTSASPVPEAIVAVETAPSAGEQKERKSKKDKKRKRDDKAATSSSSSSEDEDETPKKAKKSKSSGDDCERKAKKERKRAEKEEKRARKEAKKRAKAEALEEVKAAPTPAVIRNASRAKYLRAKSQLRGDMISMNEILGISASNSPANSPSPAPIASPAADSPALTPVVEPTDEALSARKEEKKKAKEADKAAAKEEKRAAKKAAKETSKKASKTAAEGEAEAKQPAPSLNTVSSLSVHEYLTRRLMLRKAQVARAKKADQEAVWGRLNGGQGVGVMVE